MNYLFISSQADPRLKHIARYLAIKLRQKLMHPSALQNELLVVGHDNFYVDDLFSVRHASTQSPRDRNFDVRSRLN